MAVTGLARNTPGRQDAAAIIVVLSYCLVYLAFRLLVSPNMEIDEAEQYLNGAFYAWGYRRQPPFMGWLVKTASLAFGMNAGTIVMVKYSLLFVFYTGFYFIARQIWEARRALLVTASLLVFPLYSFRILELSHTVLLAAVVSSTCLVFTFMLSERKTSHYLLLGLLAGLGVLSKYNYLFFLIALLLAGLAVKEGRAALLDGRIALSALICAIFVLPHVHWLFENGFSSVLHAAEASRAGGLDALSIGRAPELLASAYLQVFIFVAAFFAFFGRGFSWGRPVRQPAVSFSRRLALFGLLVPLAAIFSLKTGRFSERWLAPVMFAIPLALFPLADLDSSRRRGRLFGWLVVVIAAGVLLWRISIGFFPDAIGKTERVHYPFEELSPQLREELAARGMEPAENVVIIADSEHMAANLMVYLPFGRWFELKPGGAPMPEELYEQAKKGAVLVWDTRKSGPDMPALFRERFPEAVGIKTVKANYRRSRRFTYTLGLAMIAAPGDPLDK